MRDLVFMPKALGDFGWWVKNDLKTVKKIYSLLENTCKTPFEGLGQPEGLKSQLQWILV
jgi:toxin YoeB